MSLLFNPSRWRRRLVVCLLALGSGVFVANATAAEPPRPPRNTEQQQKLKEVNRLKAEAKKLAGEGKLKEAVVATEKEPTLVRELFGKEHKNVVVLLQFLAQLQERREDWAATRKARQEVLTVQQRLLGKTDWRVTDARLALAGVEQRSRLTAQQCGQLRQTAELRQQFGRLAGSGKYREAVPVVQQELTLRKELLGEQHPSYADSLNNLAGMYYEMGAYAKAEPLYQKSLALRKQVLGEKHPSYVNGLNWTSPRMVSAQKRV
jgi:tetratricopeptide (TPR) repeat protein